MSVRHRWVGCTTASGSNSPFWCTGTYWPVTSIHHRRRYASQSRAVTQSSTLCCHYWLYNATNKNKARRASVQCPETQTLTPDLLHGILSLSLWGQSTVLQLLSANWRLY